MEVFPDPLRPINNTCDYISWMKMSCALVEKWWEVVETLHTKDFNQRIMNFE